jgi:hypothetical protein
MTTPRHTSTTYREDNAHREGDHPDKHEKTTPVASTAFDAAEEGPPAYWVRTFGVGVPYEPYVPPVEEGDPAPETAFRIKSETAPAFTPAKAKHTKD